MSAWLPFNLAYIAARNKKEKNDFIVLCTMLVYTKKVFLCAHPFGLACPYVLLSLHYTDLLGKREMKIPLVT